MRKLVVLALSAAMVLGLFVVPAAAAASNGCKGIENALTKANAKGKRALEVVAEKHGCGETTPPAPDAMACPDGKAAFADWKWNGTYDPTPDAYGYGTWVGSWEHVSGTGATIVIGDAGGFYWTGAGVTHIVIKSLTGEIVTIAAIDPVSQNWLTDRTGMSEVRFCG